MTTEPRTTPRPPDGFTQVGWQHKDGIIYEEQVECDCPPGRCEHPAAVHSITGPDGIYRNEWTRCADCAGCRPVYTKANQ